jgi:hypothetical protein
MKMTAFAAVAALVAIAPTASAQRASSPKHAEDEALRAMAEERLLVASMQTSARLARLALEQARARRDTDEVRCADGALSRADVALRYGRQDASLLVDELAAHDMAAASATLQRLRQRGTAARDAAASASFCSAHRAGRGSDWTTVRVEGPGL